MEDKTRHELIERYLNGSLPEAGKQEVERLLATDAAFRSEMELHKALQQHLGDPGELRLRAALDEILEGPLSVQNPKPAPGPVRLFYSGWLRWAAVIALLVSAGYIVWFRLSRDNPSDDSRSKEADSIQLQPDTSKNTPDKGLKEQPIALADPADFTTNPALEGRIGGLRGNNDVELELVRPAPNAKFLQTGGYITLTMEGTLSADSLPVDQPLRLLIYSNKPGDWKNKNTRFNLPLPLTPAEAGEFRIHWSKTLQLRPGLYYFLADFQQTADPATDYRTLWVGKFTVETKTQ